MNESPIATTSTRPPTRDATGPSLDISLDVARGVAALAVFCFHISGMIGAVSPVLGGLALYGHMGVPIFFVISGYCMAASAHHLVARDGSALTFLHKRFLRIYPAYWASLVVIVLIPYVLAILSLLKTGNMVWPQPTWLSLGWTDWVQFITLTRVFFSDGSGLDAAFSALNIVYWTLAIEFQFYLVIFVALLLRRWYGRVLWATTIVAVCTLPFPEVKGTGLFIGHWPMFALGLGLHWLIRRRYTLGSLGIALTPLAASAFLLAFLSGLLVLAAHGVLKDLLEKLLGDASLGFAVLTALALWFMADVDGRITATSRQGPASIRYPLRAAVFLGTISYSVYLLHTKLYQLAATAARQVFPPEHPGYLLILIAGTLGLCWVFYWCFERPFISRRFVATAKLPTHATA